MFLINKIISIFSQRRLKQIDFFKQNPREAQEKVLKDLVKRGGKTLWGKEHGFGNIKSAGDFQKAMPISSYEDFLPYIGRMMKGERNILWPGKIKWFAKSSGTTGARSKFLPVSKRGLRKSSFRGGKDVAYFYLSWFPGTRVLWGQHVVVAGSLEPIKKNFGAQVGDMSAIAVRKLPLLFRFFVGPGIKTTLMKNWEEKIKKIAHIACRRNITMIAGVPSWISLLSKKFLEMEKKKNILEIWPNFEVLIHGGTSIEPYRRILEEVLPPSKIKYLEIYNASEGFFAIQDNLSRKDLLLMLDYGTFFEFLPREDVGKPDALPLTIDKVKTGVNYAMSISTESGLWRYLIGDTVQFTSLFPHRVRITGRIKHFINTFGEEVIVDNAEKAIVMACKKTNCIVREFTVAPIIYKETNQGAHEWVIEFEEEPKDKKAFEKALDESLREVNSDYDAKRFKDLLLKPPVVHFVPKETFYKWLESNGKTGAQNKVPRLSGTREYLEEILKIAKI